MTPYVCHASTLLIDIEYIRWRTDLNDYQERCESIECANIFFEFVDIFPIEDQPMPLQTSRFLVICLFSSAFSGYLMIFELAEIMAIFEQPPEKVKQDKIF